MLTMVTVQNASGDTLSLPLMDSSGGYSVQDIGGLGPVKATLTSSSLATMDGAQLQNKRREPRNITMKLGIEADYVSNDVAGLRSSLYDYLMPESEVIFSMYQDGALFASTAATVESCDPDIFSADPAVNVSLLCWDPAFYAPADTQVTGNTVSDTSQQTITYPGNAEAGFIFTIVFNRTVTELRLYNTRPDNVIQLFTLDGTFLSGDTLVINTIPGQKAVTVTRAGLVSSVLYFLDPRADWPSLIKGDNLFRAYATGAAIAWTIDYTAKYGGI